MEISFIVVTIRRVDCGRIHDADRIKVAAEVGRDPKACGRVDADGRFGCHAELSSATAPLTEPYRRFFPIPIGELVSDHGE